MPSPSQQLAREWPPLELFVMSPPLRLVRSALVALAFGAVAAFAHPTGTMLHVGDVLLWSYVCPVDSPDHRGCVMAWDPANGVRPWLVSDRGASDWMIARTYDGEVLLIERAFDAERNVHRARLLAAAPLGEPRVLWDWFDDTHRFGEAGFAALPDGRMLFVRHPNALTLEHGGEPQPWKPWPHAVTGLEDLGGGKLLLNAEDEAWVVDVTGEIVEHWPALLVDPVGDLPFMGNRVFDLTWDGSSLVLAYWGQRRFDALDDEGRTTLHAVAPPFLPHAVASGDGRAYFLASSIAPGTSIPIRPRLWIWDDGSLELLWGDP